MTSINSVLTFASVPVAALRRRRRQRLRAHPRRRRAARVHPRQGDHPAAVRPAGQPDELRPPGRRRGRTGPGHGHRARPPPVSLDEFDVVVVGAGSAGCTLAARLTEDPALRVLLLEAGGSDDVLEVQIPAALYKVWRTRRDWNYATEPQPGLGGRELFWPRGKLLGGSSSINAMIYIRGRPRRLRRVGRPHRRRRLVLRRRAAALPARGGQRPRVVGVPRRRRAAAGRGPPLPAPAGPAPSSSPAVAAGPRPTTTSTAPAGGRRHLPGHPEARDGAGRPPTPSSGRLWAGRT